jgi:hypothetical protein
MFPLPIFGDMEKQAGTDDLPQFHRSITHGRTLRSHRTPLQMHIHRSRLAQVERDISVGTANLYGLNGPWIESRWRWRFFRTSPDRHWALPNLLYNGHGVPFPGDKGAGAWC